MELDVHERVELVIAGQTLRVDRQGTQMWLSLGVPSAEGDTIYPQVELSDEQRVWLRGELAKGLD
jgi:hypothetical protein